MIFSIVLSAAGLVAGWILFWRIPRIQPTSSIPATASGADLISLVIPARNEENTLPLLLASLKEQWPAEVIVVDDHSTDRTAELAAQAGARVLRSAALPAGWTGKNFACAQGAEAASQDWLLFVDADTMFEPAGLDRLRSLLAQEDAEQTAFSLLPYHRTQRPYEEFSLFFNLLMAAGAGGFGLFSSPCLFGQSLLISRKLYETCGGHTAVRGQILENFALTQDVLDASGRCVCFRGRGTLAMRMYSKGMGQLYEGWTKAFVAGAARSGSVTLLLSVLWLTALFATFSWLITSPKHTLAAVFYGALALQLALVSRQIGSFRWYSFALYPIPLTFFFLLFGRALLLRALGQKAVWSGRKL